MVSCSFACDASRLDQPHKDFLFGICFFDWGLLQRLHAKGLALCGHITLDASTPRGSRQGHPRYTGGPYAGRPWVADNKPRHETHNKTHLESNMRYNIQILTDTWNHTQYVVFDCIKKKLSLCNCYSGSNILINIVCFSNFCSILIYVSNVFTISCEASSETLASVHQIPPYIFPNI